MRRFHLFKRDEEYILYDNKNIDIFSIKKDMGEKLEKYEYGELEKLLNNSPTFSDKENAIYLCQSNNSNKKCERLILILSKACNLNCKYCYAQGGDYGTKHSENMSIDTVKKSIEYTLEKYPEGIDYIQFFGGEPLLNFDVLEKSCKWIIEYFKEKGLEVPKYTIVTNGTLINEKSEKLFNEYFSSVTISLDGDKETNDFNRIFKNDDNSVHDKVIENINRLNKNRKYHLDIEITVDDNHLVKSVKDGYKEKNLEYVESLGVNSIHMAPVINTKTNKHSITNVGMDAVKSFFHDHTKYNFRTESPKDIKIAKIAALMSAVYKKKFKENFCNAGINNIAIDVNGDVYPCFMFIGVEEYKMGNIKDTQENDFIRIKTQCEENTIESNSNCKDCWATKICAQAYSGCIGTLYFENGDIKKPVKEKCEISKVVLEEVLYQIKKYSEVKKSYNI